MWSTFFRLCKPLIGLIVQSFKPSSKTVNVLFGLF